jgi:hypothetical protein
MVQDAEETVDGLHSEAAVEAVAGSEAEATTKGEVPVLAADTRMEEGEVAVFTTESALSLSVCRMISTICFFIIFSKSNEFFVHIKYDSVCSSLVLCNQCLFLPYSNNITKTPKNAVLRALNKYIYKMFKLQNSGKNLSKIFPKIYQGHITI